jgi:hypothetical protein
MSRKSLSGEMLFKLGIMRPFSVKDAMLQPWPHGVIAVPMRRIDASLIALSTRLSWLDETDMEGARYHIDGSCAGFGAVERMV